MRTLLVSVDLTSGKASATGGCPRFVPGPVIGEIPCRGRTNSLRQLSGGCEKFEASGHKKRDGMIPGGKLAFPRDSPVPFPGALCAPVRRLKAAVPGSTRYQAGCSRFLKQLRETCLSAAASNIRKCGSRDEPPMTACGGNLIGGEIKRNELLSACSVERSETEGAQFFNCRPKPALPEGSSAGRLRSCDD